MNILVTGGAGYIGSQLAAKLAEEDSVTVLDCMQTKERIPNISRYIVGDITDYQDCVKAVRANEVVYHLAARANVDTIADNPIDAVYINILGTALLLEAARTYGIKRFIYASTVYVYDRYGHLYTTTKRAGEDLVMDYCHLYKLPFTILRYCTVYGPGNRDDNVVNAFVRRALAGEPLTIHGNGKQLRRYLYIDDAVAGSVYALEGSLKNKTANMLGSLASVNDVADIVRDLAGNVLVHHDDARPHDYTGKMVEDASVVDILGETSLRAGIEKTVEAYRKQEKVQAGGTI